MHTQDSCIDGRAAMGAVSVLCPYSRVMPEARSSSRGEDQKRVTKETATPEKENEFLGHRTSARASTATMTAVNTHARPKTVAFPPPLSPQSGVGQERADKGGRSCDSNDSFCESMDEKGRDCSPFSSSSLSLPFLPGPAAQY
ncbi:hypothetical protein Naga_101528g1 [Nannochloropsis gaditana]|uniref:Uncharacterized protein n=1 Tax=Nannochloropsis gaditana TaxID=72520 RepID=W7TGT0_9STRA|nr:hypothetical protein Naga_101528g1 [Nannochloropsis gaditana]